MYLNVKPLITPVLPSALGENGVFIWRRRGMRMGKKEECDGRREKERWGKEQSEHRSASSIHPPTPEWARVKAPRASSVCPCPSDKQHFNQLCWACVGREKPHWRLRSICFKLFRARLKGNSLVAFHFRLASVWESATLLADLSVRTSKSFLRLFLCKLCLSGMETDSLGLAAHQRI